MHYSKPHPWNVISTEVSIPCVQRGVIVMVSDGGWKNWDFYFRSHQKPTIQHVLADDVPNSQDTPPKCTDWGYGESNLVNTHLCYRSSESVAFIGWWFEEISWHYINVWTKTKKKIITLPTHIFEVSRIKTLKCNWFSLFFCLIIEVFAWVVTLYRILSFHFRSIAYRL